jgi:hypothetical protein
MKRMNTDDFIWWANFREQTKPYLENDEYKMICEIYARVNDLKLEYPCKCNPEKIQRWIDELNLEYEKL